MGRPPGWAAALTGRAVMLSPGRPPVRRDLERAFWVQIARGLTSEDAAVACGVSSPVGSRWFRHAGGMPPIELAPVSGRYLSFSEREDIAVLRAEGIGATDRDPDRKVTVDDISGTASQRRHPQREARLPGIDGAVEGRSRRTTTQSSETR